MVNIPEKNITFLLDATVGQITQGITKLNLLSKACNGKSQLMFFYAGHGLPDETTKEPYLIPVDVSGANVTTGIKLNDLYKSLTEFPSERVTVFLDACFTGGSRNAGLIAGRSVKINPKINILTKNIIVFSSSSSEQSSLSYAEKNHGMFTYFLLKKIQETKGELTYSELFDFASSGYVTLSKKGDIIAYRSVLSNELACTSAKVIEDCQVCFIPSEILISFIKTNPNAFIGSSKISLEA